MSKLKKLPLVQILILSMVAFVTFGTLFIHSDDIGIYADASNYERSSLPMQIPTAFADFKTNKARGENSDASTQAVTDLINGHFGNVGILIGPRDGSATSTNLGSLHDTNNISTKSTEISTLLGSSDGVLQASKNIEQYYAFGQAIHRISERGSKLSPSATNLASSLDSISNLATSISGAGMKLLIEYNPEPFIKQLYTGKRAIEVAPENKLVRMFSNTVVEDIWNAITIKPISGVEVTLTTLIVAVIVILLVIGSIVSTLFGGRAGESLKKALVRIVAASVAVPLIALVLGWGIEGAKSITNYGVSPEELEARKYISQHLDLAGWYETGFAVPPYQEITVRNGAFSLTRANVRAINIMSYMHEGTGAQLPDYDVSEWFENIENGTDWTEGEMVLEIYDSIQAKGKANKNQTTPNFIMSGSEGAKQVSNVASKIGAKEGAAVATDGDDDEGEDEGESEESEDVENIYLSPSRFLNEMDPNPSDGKKTYTLTRNGNDGGESYGISPIASYHMMYADFSGGNIKTETRVKPFTSIIYYADNGEPGVNASGEQEPGTGMNSFIRFIATITIAIAALKGLGQIIMGGFGGMIAGTARSTVGSAAGLGQAVGGVIALVVGVVGMSFIIDISFELLDAIWDILKFILKGDETSDSIMEPIAEAINEKLPWWLSFLGDMLKNFAIFVTSIIAAFAIPKFGSIPIDMFAAKMSELPGNISDRAQQMENKFTGDFRGGGGGGGFGGGGARSGVNSALTGATKQAKGLGQAGLAGAGMALGLAGMGLSKVANRNSKAGDLSKSESLANNDNYTEGPEGPGGNDVENQTEAETMSFSDVDAQDTSATDADTTSEIEGAENEMTSEQDSISDSNAEFDGGSEEFESMDETHGADEENIHEQAGAEQETVQQTEALHDESSEHSQAGADNDSVHEQTGADNESVHEQAGIENETMHEQSGAENEIVHEQGGIENDTVHEQAGADSGTVHEHAGAENNSMHERAGAENNTKHEQAGAENNTMHEQAGAETASTVNTSSMMDSTHEQSGGTHESVQSSVQNSDVKSDTKSDTSKESSTQNTSQSRTQNTSQSKSESVSNTEAGGSVSGDSAPTASDAPKGATTGPSPAGQTVNAKTPTGQSIQPGQGKQAGPNVRNENKTHNQNSSSMNANATVGGDTVIDKSVDKPTSGGESLSQRDSVSQKDSTAPRDSAPTSEKEYVTPPAGDKHISTRAKRALGAVKRVAGKDNRNRAIGALGKGMQAAGGELSLKRASAAILHAGASTTGLQDTMGTKNHLDRASGKQPQQTDKKNEKVNKNKQQDKNRQNSINEQAIYHAEQERRESDRRKNPRK